VPDKLSGIFLVLRTDEVKRIRIARFEVAPVITKQRQKRAWSKTNTLCAGWSEPRVVNRENIKARLTNYIYPWHHSISQIPQGQSPAQIPQPIHLFGSETYSNLPSGFSILEIAFCGQLCLQSPQSLQYPQDIHLFCSLSQFEL